MWAVRLELGSAPEWVQALVSLSDSERVPGNWWGGVLELELAVGKALE